MSKDYIGKEYFPKKDILKFLEKHLDKNRFEHTLSVSYTAMNLAALYGESIERAEIAGLLHDCAKNFDYVKKEKYIKKYNIDLTEEEKAIPSIIHAKIGMYIAKKKFDIKDIDILNAISYHTTGRSKMSLLEKIIYIADYIEPRRKIIPSLMRARQLAYQNLDLCMQHILSSVLDYLKDKQIKIANLTFEAYNDYKDM